MSMDLDHPMPSDCKGSGTRMDYLHPMRIDRLMQILTIVVEPMKTSSTVVIAVIVVGIVVEMMLNWIFSLWSMTTVDLIQILTNCSNQQDFPNYQD